MEIRKPFGAIRPDGDGHRGWGERSDEAFIKRVISGREASFVRHKGRIVSLGYMQIPGVDYAVVFWLK
jgi:hypothetical protein